MPPMASSPVQKQYCERATVLVATALGFAGASTLLVLFVLARTSFMRARICSFLKS